MPLKWISEPKSTDLPLTPGVPIIVLAAPGSVKPGQRLTKVLAASSLLASAAWPFQGPMPPAATNNAFTVTNTHPAGPGSLFDAVRQANANPGADVINFDPSVSGTIALTGTLHISDSVTIQGPGAGKLSLSGGNARRVFYLSSPSQTVFSATISGLTIRDGNGTKVGGGGIYDKNANLTLDLVDILSNTAASKGSGAGVDFAAAFSLAVSLTIRNSLISGNIAGGSGGGVDVYSAINGVVIQNTQFISNTAVDGGGVDIVEPASTLIEDSSFLSNTATNRGGGLSVYLPGAFTIRRTTFAANKAYTGGGIDGFNTGSLTIENTTISGNHATGSGGGINFYASQNASIHNSTIVSNTAVDRGGGIYLAQNFLPITDTIIAGNAAISMPVSSDLTGTFQLRNDLVQITGTATITDAGGNLFGLDPLLDPLLGPLANNGGPTQTHFPRHGSPVINAGDPAFAPPPATDQRGDPRVWGGRIDIGAVETVELFLPLVRR